MVQVYWYTVTKQLQVFLTPYEAVSILFIATDEISLAF